MDITPIQMYWILKLDNIIDLFVGVGLATGIGSILFCVVGALSIADYKAMKKKTYAFILSIVLFISFFSFASASFIPSTKQLAAIIVIPKIINNEQIQEIPNKILTIGLEWLDEIKPSKESK